MGKKIRTTNPKPKSVSNLPTKSDKDQLEALLPRIQGACEMVEHRLADALEYARDAGEMLAEAKKLAGHGGWLPYLKECGIPERTASDYMRIFKNWKTLRSATLPDFTHRKAIAYLRQEEKEEKERLDRWKAQQEADDAVEETEETEEQKQTAAYQRAMYERQETEQAEWDAKAPEREARRKTEEAKAAARLDMAQELIVAGRDALAKKYHRDKPGGSKEAFQELEDIKKELLDYAEEQYEMLVPAVRP